MVRLQRTCARGATSRWRGWRWGILRGAIIGILPIVGACSNSVKQSHEINGWNGQLDHPVVISGNPGHDSLVNAAAEAQLSESDWRVLESLGPKAIWQRIDEMNRSTRERTEQQRSQLA